MHFSVILWTVLFAYQHTKSISVDYLFLLMFPNVQWFSRGREISQAGKWKTILLIFLRRLKQFRFQFEFHLEYRVMFPACYKNMFSPTQFINSYSDAHIPIT